MPTRKPYTVPPFRSKSEQHRITYICYIPWRLSSLSGSERKSTAQFRKHYGSGPFHHKRYPCPGRSVLSLAVASLSSNFCTHHMVSALPRSAIKRSPAVQSDFADRLPCSCSCARWVPSTSAPYANDPRPAQLVWASLRDPIPTSRREGCFGTIQCSCPSPSAL